MTIVSDVPIVGVGAVIVADDRILLIKRGRDPGKGLWAVPGGKVRLGESMRDAVTREISEETGLAIDVGDVIWVGELIDADHHLVLVDFEAQVAGGELIADDDAEEARWVPLTEAESYPLTPSMYDLMEALKS